MFYKFALLRKIKLYKKVCLWAGAVAGFAWDRCGSVDAKKNSLSSYESFCTTKQIRLSECKEGWWYKGIYVLLLNQDGFQQLGGWWDKFSGP
ncbi:MAG: hypothetical protein ABI045_07210 [Flavobacteriales bacterium]